MHSVIIACTITTLITTYIYIASFKVQLSQQLHCSVSYRWGYCNRDIQIQGLQVVSLASTDELSYPFPISLPSQAPDIPSRQVSEQLLIQTHTHTHARTHTHTHTYTYTPTRFGWLAKGIFYDRCNE